MEGNCFREKQGEKIGQRENLLALLSINKEKIQHVNGGGKKGTYLFFDMARGTKREKKRRIVHRRIESNKIKFREKKENL